VFAAMAAEVPAFSGLDAQSLGLLGRPGAVCQEA
jgi:hypothetical protein